jgi:hypothetical protein
MALAYNPQGSTAALNQAGYLDTPEGRAAYPGTTYPTSGGSNVADTAGGPLGDSIQKLLSAMASGNAASAQEAIRQFNLTYTNQVGELYGQNFGVGQPAPPGVPTLPAGQAVGSIGYIPGFTGTAASQTQSELAQQASTAQGAAGLTGFYTAPSQSQYTPGTFVRLDPSTYDTNTYGPVQISYVLPTGQLQRVNIPQAQAMGWNGNLSTMNVLPAQTAMALEQAPPSQLPMQTMAGLTNYSNLNTAAINQAIAQAGVTGMYSAPAAIVAPGTNAAGGKFSDLDQGTQRAYFVSNGGDWNAAMNKWVADSNNAIRQATEAAGGTWTPNQPGAPQATLQAQQQTYAQQMGLINQAASLQANPFRQQQAIGQMGSLLAGGGVASFSAPNTVAGVGTAGGNTQGGMGYLQQMIDDIRNPTPNQTSMNQVLNAIPTPNKVNSTEFLRAAPSTQNMVLQGMQEKYGIDPNDAMTQIKATLPQFQAPTTVGAVRR